jgi:hypothetical protein
MKTPAIICTMIVMAALAGLTPASGDSIADFSGGLGYEKPNQFPGSAGQGWIDGWEKSFNRSPDGIEFEIVKDPEFGNDVDNLQISRTNSSNIVRLSRILDTSTTDLSKPHLVSFTIRADSYSNLEYNDFRFSISGVNQEFRGNLSPNNSVWSLASRENLTWAIYHGNEHQELASIMTPLPFAIGEIFRIRISIFPEAQKFQVSIESNAQFYESPEFLFANQDPGFPADMLVFAGWVTDDGPGDFCWTLGPVKVENVEH